MGTNQRSAVVMTDEEVADFVAAHRTATFVTLGPSGHPHAMAMWFGVIDGVIWFETKAKSQKAVNLRRDARATALIEDGLTYDQLHGVSLEGEAVIVDDPAALQAVGVSVWERYYGPYTDALAEQVDQLMNNRVAIRFDVSRTRSWDHRKLGLPAMPLAEARLRMIEMPQSLEEGSYLARQEATGLTAPPKLFAANRYDIVTERAPTRFARSRS